MQLKRLEAYGFKSFADKTEIVFHPGITAVVGPNGSGKSNITDAIRWVLGEQNARNLRAAKAEDIIFAGSSERRPLNVAEVSLVFDNSDGTLPIAYQEVVVTRRLFRSGESESYINQTRCRIKDVYQLFADTGIGHEGMSIIGQNRIDRILNSRPEERRAFFEETAGITKYKARKGEALQKMEATEKNLVRVQDIMQEIEGQLLPLAKQAERTRAFDDLSAKYRRYEVSSLRGKYGGLEAQRAEKQAERENVQQQQVALLAEIEKRGAEREQVKLQVIEQENTLQGLAKQEKHLQEQSEQLQSALSALKERCASEETAYARLQKQEDETAKELEVDQVSSAQLSDGIIKDTSAIKAMEEELAKAREQSDRTAAALAKAKEASSAARTKEDAQRSLWNARKQALAVLEKSLEWNHENRQEREGRRREWEKRIAHLQVREEKTQASLTSIRQEAERIEQDLSQVVARHRETQAKLTRERTLQQRQREQAKELTSRWKILERMQQTYEGFGASVRAVLRSEESWGIGVCGAVAELIDVPEQYVTALEVALAGSQQHVVTTDTETAKEAIAYLKRRRLGRVTFLPLTSLVVQTSKGAEHLLEMEGAIGFANHLIRVEERYRRVADFLLGRTLVADTLEHALAIAKAARWRQRIVTLEGELLHAGGSLSGGGRMHREASFLGRRSELELCRKRREALATEEAARKQQIGELTLEFSAQEKAQAALEQRRQGHSLREAELTTSLSAIGNALQQERRGFQEFSAQQAAKQQSLAKAESDHLLLQEQVQDAERRLRQCETVSGDRKQEEDALAVEADTWQRRIYSQETDHAVRVANLDQARSRLEDTQKRMEQKKQVLADVRKELTQMDSQGEKNRSAMETVTKDLERLRDQRQQLRHQQDACYTGKMRLLEQDKDMEQDIKTLSSRQREQQETVHQLDLQISRVAYEMEECAQALLSKYGLTPDAAAEQCLDLPNEEIAKQLRKLQREIEALGPVNPGAIKEYEQQQKRLEFIQQQAQDLEDAKGDLLKLIEEMDETMRQRFQAAFSQIQQYFHQCFTKLFGGGQAELKLLDADILHAGIDILVTLPRKKRQGLSALSGGERALTVIALLFAFLMYKPSPFSVLDEIDAPLDEANVVRFGAFLEELSHATQFIVVTHRKGTMEAADTMYGVTTDGTGVSKVLSVRLDDVAD